MSPEQWATVDEAARIVRPMTDRSGNEWMTYAQAAEWFRLDAALIRKWASKGVVEKIRYRGRVGVRMADVARAERSLRMEGSRLGRGRTRRAVATAVNGTR